MLGRIAAREIDPYAAAELGDGARRRHRTGGGLHRWTTSGSPWLTRARSYGCSAICSACPTDEPEVVGLHRLRFVDAGGATLELVEADRA